MTWVTRRLLLKLSSASAGVFGFFRSKNASANESRSSVNAFASNWAKTNDRVFLGGNYWANPMEDWRVENGAAECKTTGGFRNIQLLTHQIENVAGSFELSVDVSHVETRKSDGGVGFQIGIKSDINEHRSNAFAKNGVKAGIVDGEFVLGRKRKAVDGLESSKSVQLQLSGMPVGNKYALTLVAKDKAGKEIGSVTHQFPTDYVLGNVALVNNFDPALKKGQGSRYRFANWKASGDAFVVHEENRFGPILWSMYTLSDNRNDEGFVMTMNALTGPLGKKDNQSVELQIEKDGKWKSLGKSPLDTDAWTAKFRVTNWDEKKATKYRLVYDEQHTDGTQTQSTWDGTIKPNPTGRPLRLGALTCQNDYAFPYEPVANNITKLDPDMLYFSGDQLYENHGGYGLIRDPAGPAILNYLRKFYQFGWSFRHALKNAPTVCLADDHDVFQGNIWGEGGAKMDRTGGTSSKGGYREPARMVNVVHRTCAGHHPDYFDPAPSKQDISVYFGDMVYGDVSFAILSDRQFKSGPERVSFWSGRADHVKDESIDVRKLDKEGLELLGERQENFLKHWVKDWRGHSMKVLLSQTVFAGVATHHGSYDGYLRGDLDSGAWPQTPRNNAINILREGMPLHINGDQHLTTMVQYGVEEQRDSCWSFCTPAIAVGYPRWWRPDEVGMKHENRPKHGLANTGEFIDSFGNKAYVYAVGNPIVPTKKNRYERAHQKGSGFGFVTIDTQKKTYYIESYRFLVDPTDGKVENQFPGWPLTIHQKENKGDNVIQ